MLLVPVVLGGIHAPGGSDQACGDFQVIGIEQVKA